MYILQNVQHERKRNRESKRNTFTQMSFGDGVGECKNSPVIPTALGRAQGSWDPGLVSLSISLGNLDYRKIPDGGRDSLS